MAVTTATPWQITSRVAASLLGSYAFVGGLVMLGIGVGLQMGMAYGDAMALASLYAFVVFLVAFMWAFAARSVARVWVVLFGGGLAMAASGWWVARAAG